MWIVTSHWKASLLHGKEKGVENNIILNYRKVNVVSTDALVLTWSRSSEDITVINTISEYLHMYNSGLSVEIYCWGSEALTILILKVPEQILAGPIIEIHYQFSNLGGSIGPSGKISQAWGPYWIFRGLESPDFIGIYAYV